MIADKGYDSDRLRKALAERGIKACPVLDTGSCIPGRANRKEPVVYDIELYKSRNLTERLVWQAERVAPYRPHAMIAVRTPSTALSVLLPRLSSGYES